MTSLPSTGPQPADGVPPLGRGTGLFVALLSGLVLLSAVVGAGAAALHAPPIWFMLGFEVIIAVAGVFGVLTGLGRFLNGPALALVCVAGAVGAGSLLGFLAGRGNLAIDLWPFLMARGVAAAAILAMAGWAVLSRRPQESWRRLGVGIACLIGFGAIAGGLWVAQGWLTGLGTMPGAIIGLVAGATLLGLLAAAVHHVIRAFETGAAGLPADEPAARTATTGASPGPI